MGFFDRDVIISEFNADKIKSLTNKEIIDKLKKEQVDSNELTGRFLDFDDKESQ